MELLAKGGCAIACQRELQFLAFPGQNRTTEMVSDESHCDGVQGSLAGQRKAFELLAREYALRAGGQSRPSEPVSEEALRSGAGLASPGRGHEGKLTLLS